MRKRMQVCVHDAGQAVIARVLGLKGGEVTVVKPRRKFFTAVIEDPEEAASRWQREGKRWREGIYAFCISIQAGWEAERLLLYRSGSDNGSHDSFLVSAVLYDSIDYLDREPTERRLRRRTIKLVRLHREKIQRVADALNKHGTLSDRQVRRIMNICESLAAARTIQGQG